MTLLILYGVLALGVSFICSLLEAGLLSLPHSHVESLVERGVRVGKTLKSLKNNIDRPLAAILTFNTVAHTVGAAGVGAQAAVVFGNTVDGATTGGETAVGVASAVMTVLILVFSEIIPKTLGAVHAKRLAHVTAWLTQLMIYTCLPVIWVLERVNRLIGYQRTRDRVERMEVMATIRLGGEGGALADREHRIAMNVMGLASVPLAKILTPRTVLFTLPEATTVDEALDEHHPIRFSRIPVYETNVDQMTGYVPRFEIHRAAAEGRRDATLADLKQPILMIPELASIADALEQMLDRGEHIALAVDEYGGVAGIITLEDVIESLLGQEITDETDLITDMRELAKNRAARERGESTD